MVQVRRPVIRYHGGKFNLAPWIISEMPVHNIYVEVFGGGGSVLLRKPKSPSEVYNDLWREITNVFRVLREEESSAKLKELLRLTPFAREELMNSIIPSEDPIEQARRTLTRSWLIFSAANFAQGTQMTFAGSIDNGIVHRVKEWREWQEHIDSFTSRLREVVVENMTAVEVIRKYDSEDSLFVEDPPYLHDTRVTVNDAAGYAHEMTDLDHVELAHVNSGVKGMVIVCGYHSKLYDDLYRGWKVVERQASTERGQSRVEVLWLNKACVERQSRQLNMFLPESAPAAQMITLPQTVGETLKMLVQERKLEEGKEEARSLFDLL